MQPTQTPEGRGEFHRRRAPEKCEWSKPTRQGPVIDVLSPWAANPDVETWIRGLPMPGLSKDAKRACLTQLCGSLSAVIGLQPVPSDSSGCAFHINGLSVRLLEDYLEVSMPLVPPKFGIDVLRYWQCGAHSAVFLAGVDLPDSKVYVKLPFIAFGEQDAQTIVDAIRFVQREAKVILSVFGLHPEVAILWEQWVLANLGQGEGGEDNGTHRDEGSDGTAAGGSGGE